MAAISRNFMYRNIMLAVCAVPAILSTPVDALAQVTYTWTGAASNDWNDAANWLDNGQPVVNGPDSGITVVVGGLGINQPTNPLVGAGQTITSGPFSYIGDRTPGSITIQDSGRWTASGNIVSGYSSTGSITIQRGGVVNGQILYIGFNANGNGTITVTDAGSQLTSSNFIVGQRGNASLNIENAGLVTSNAGTIGVQTGSVGTVNVTGTNGGTASRWNITAISGLTVGSAGNGTLNISLGGLVSNVSGSIGSAVGSTGVVNVRDSGSLWSNSSTLNIGNAGTGTLNVFANGTVTSLNGSIGTLAGGIGVVDVNGTSWTNTGTGINGVLYVGNAGTGTLTIQNGGTVSNVTSYLGYSGANSRGTVNVTGVGSRWVNTGAVNVGYEGDATLIIANAGEVSTTVGVNVSGNGGSGIIAIGATEGNTALAPGVLTAPLITMGARGTLVFNHTSSNYTFSVAATGAGALHQIAGTTVLTSANSYTGGTTISGGTLQLGNGVVSGSITGNVVNNAILAFNNPGAAIFSGVISGTGALSKTGTGTQTLSGVNSYEGGTTIGAGGTLVATNGGALGSGTVNTTGTLQLDFAANSTLANVLTGTGGLTKTGAGTASLTATGSSVGAVTVQTGGLSLEQSGVFNATSYAMSGGATSLTANSRLAVAGAYNQSAGTTLNVAFGSNSPVISANTATLSGILNITGFSTTDPNRASELTSTLYTVIQTTGGITGDFTSVDLGSAANTVDYLRLAGRVSADSLSYNVGFGLTWLEGTTFGNGTFTLTNAGGTFDVDVILADQAASGTGWNGRDLTKIGAGTLTLSAVNTYTGATAVNGGTLRAGIANTFASSSSVTVDSGATLNLNNFNQTANNLSGAGNVTLGSATLTVNNTAATTFSGVISGTGALSKTGTGTLTLSGVNSYEGGTTIGAGGTLVATNGGALGSGTVNTTGTLQLDFAANSTLANVLTGTGGLTKTGAGTASLTATGSSVGAVTVQTGGLSLEQSGVFNATSYTMSGGATSLTANSRLAVTGAYNQSAGTTLNVAFGSNSPVISANTATLSGILNITGFSTTEPNRASALTSTLYTVIQTTGGITGDFTSVNLGGAANTVDYLSLAGRVSADNLSYNVGFRLTWLEGTTLGNGTFTLTNAGDTFDVDVLLADQAASGTGWNGIDLTKAGAGTLTLSAVNTYTGATAVNGGTLRAGIANTFAASSSVTVVSGATLNLNNFNQTANNLSGAGNITLGSATLTANNTSATTFSGVISGTGALSKTGTGTLILTGSATHSGLTTVTTGTLSVGDGGTSGSITGDILNNATLVFNRSDATRYDGILSGDGALIKQGADILTLSGVGSGQGSVDVKTGSLRFENVGPFTTSGDYTTRSAATTQIGSAGTTLVIGGAFTQETGATLDAILGSSPDITATTAPLSGSLIIGGFVDRSQPVKASEATATDYVFIRTTGGITGDFVNNPLLPTSLDYLLHDGYISPDNLDYRLGFRLAWLEGGQSEATGSFTLNDGTAFDVDVALVDQVIPSGDFASGWDGRSLVKAGLGRLVLSAVNGYTGTTTVNDGTLEFGVANSIATSSDVIVTGGVVDLKGYDQQFNRLAGTGGTVDLNGATLTVHNAAVTDETRYEGTISGSGTFVKTGDGVLTLAGETLWQGQTHLQGGSLVLDGSLGGAKLKSDVIGSNGTSLSLHNGAVLTGTIDPADVDIDGTSQWNMTGSSVVATMTLAGTIDVQPSGQPMVSGHTLTAQNWVGQGGLVVLNAVLGDDSSVSDRIIIDGGTATGTTRLDIRNQDGLGAQTSGNGIVVVEAINGARTTLDNADPSQSQTFRLLGRVAAGAYEYQLYSGGNASTGGNVTDQNWYLRSYNTSPNPGPNPGPAPEPVYRPEVPTNSVIQPLALDYGYAMLDTLHQRSGAALYLKAPVSEDRVVRCADGRQKKNCVVKAPVSVQDQQRWAGSGWARLIGSRGFRDADSFGRRGPDYDYTFGGIQAGLDVYGREQADGTVDKAGLYVGYGQIASTVKGQPGAYYGGKAGSVDMDAYTVGAYWTHLSARGWYTDAVVQGTWYSADARSVSGQQIKPDGFGILASLEGGYRFALGQGWSVEPQAQLVYQSVSFDSAKDAFGHFNFEDSDSLRGRLGLRVVKDVMLSENTSTLRMISFWGRANVWHEYYGATKTVVTTLDNTSPVMLSSRLGGTWGEIGAGVNAQVSDSMTLFATGAYQHSLDNRGREAWDGRMGMTLRW